jgi:hypothetical protein
LTAPPAQQRALESRDGGDVGPGRALAHRDADAGAPQDRARLAYHLALADEIVQDRRVEDRGVERLTRLDAALGLDIDVEVQRDTVPALALEARAELPDGGAGAVAADHLELGRDPLQRDREQCGEEADPAHRLLVMKTLLGSST